MEVYAIPVLTETGKIKWIHAKDFNPDVDRCHCPECNADRSAYRKIILETQEEADE